MIQHKDPLNPEQTAALQAIQAGRNIFLTGPGGTGKSFTVQQIMIWAKSADILVAVTAMTGCAALLVNAKTLHGWAGIGLGRESPEILATAILKKSKSKRNWIDTRLLIIDEISMMTPELLEKLDHVARRVRKKPDTRFGGLQLVLVGDFCQLPPVQKGASQFAFESPVWSTLIDETHTLTRIERQKDPVFQRILCEARLGELSPESIGILKSRVGLDWKNTPDGIQPTLIYSRKAQVDEINRSNMEELDGESMTFEVQTVFKGPFGSATKMTFEVESALHRLDQDANYEQSLELKVGAQVMLISNIAGTKLVNGSRGVVTGFSPSGLPMVRFKDTGGSVMIDRVSWFLPEAPIGRSQIPLKVAYAITIHKSQGSSLDSALIDIGSSVFEYGQAYVALSRVRTLEGLYIFRFSPSSVVCNPKVKAFMGP